MGKPKKPGPFPEDDDRTIGVAVAKTTLKAAAGYVVPVLGGAIGDLVERAITEPLRLRQEEWFRTVGEGLEELQERFGDFDPATLSENEEFLSTVAQATTQAIRTHRREKLDALRAAVLNTALGIKLDEVMRARFLTLVDQYSPLHLRVLGLYDNPRSYPEIVRAAESIMAGGFRSLAVRALPELAENEALLDAVEQDLTGDNLIEGSSRAMVSGGSLLNKRTSDRGTAFLQFIADPRESE